MYHTVKQNGSSMNSDKNDSEDAESSLDGFEDYEAPWNDPDRGRGILTSTDRRYLLNQAEFEGQDERNARYRIRKRILHSLYDIYLINHHVQMRDIEQVMEEISTSPSSQVLQLAYNLIKHDENIDNDIEYLEERIESLVSMIEIDGKTRLASVNIETEEYSKEELIETHTDEIYSDLDNPTESREEVLKQVKEKVETVLELKRQNQL